MVIEKRAHALFSKVGNKYEKVIFMLAVFVYLYYKRKNTDVKAFSRLFVNLRLKQIDIYVKLGSY